MAIRSESDRTAEPFRPGMPTDRIASLRPEREAVSAASGFPAEPQGAAVFTGEGEARRFLTALPSGS